MSQIAIKKSAREYGSHIPGDVSLAGFSINPISALIDPPLTRGNQPAFKIGPSAAAVLHERIHSGAIPETPKTGVLLTELFLRGLA